MTRSDPLQVYECTQCGATDFEALAAARVRCAYCGSLFERIEAAPKLTIRKGANVVFGPHAQVEVRGGVEIEPGARVDIQGRVVLVGGEKVPGLQLRYLPPEADARR
jgi:hypothetical protein